MMDRIEIAARALMKARYPSPDTPWESFDAAVQEQAKREARAVAESLWRDAATGD